MDRLECYIPIISRPSKRRFKSDGNFPEFSMFDLNKSLLTSGDTRKWLELLSALAERRSEQIKESGPVVPSTIDLSKPISSDQLRAFGNAALFSDDLRFIYVFLVLLGKDCFKCDKPQDAVRVLEAAKAVPCAFPLDFALILDVTLAWCYKAIGESSKCGLLCETYAPLIKVPFEDRVSIVDDEFSADVWEHDLFGGNSRTMALDSTPGGAVVAARCFRAGELMYIDKPVVGYVANSQIQCNHCTMKSLHLVPCFTCRLVCYCSLACMEKDAHYHQFECTGYRLLFFPLVFGVLELRMLVKAMDILEHVLTSKQTVLSSSVPTAAAPLQEGPAFAQQLWDVLLEGREDFPDFFHILLAVKLKYSDLSFDDHQALVLKARMLVQYLQYTGLLEKKYPSIVARASNNEWDMFLASLLLRFAMLTTNRSSTFSYNLLFDEQCKQQVTKVTDQCTSMSNSGNSVCKFGVSLLSPLIEKLQLKSWDECDATEMKQLLEEAMSEIEKCDQQLDNPPIPDEKKSPEQLPFEKFSIDRDSVAELWDEAILEAAQECEEKNVILSALRLYTSKYVGRYLLTKPPNAPFTLPNQYFGMYRSTVELRHSSTPNTTAVLLTQGVVGIYASSDIEKGETLTMSHGKTGGSKQHLGTPAVSHNGIRCKSCRFDLSPSRRDACHCEATPLEGPMSTMVEVLCNIEDEHVVLLSGKVDAENPCVPLQHFEKLWNSIFVSDFNTKSYSNRKKQLQALTDHADFGTGNAPSLCRIVLYLVHALTSHIREVYKPNSIARLQELMFVMKNTISLFIRRKCPDGVVGSVLNIFKQIEDVCREAETIANIWMEYQQLAELVMMRGLLDRSKRDFIKRFAANL